MCGIVGQAVCQGATDFAAMQCALNAIAHRGPDDAGLERVTANSPDVDLVLGNRRLAILDLSAAGHQPMHDVATGNCIVFNGEIFNFKEIRRDLENLGIHFSSHTDTEVVLKAYAIHGEQCLNLFRGMFAFALWDAEREQLFLCRDRLGIKPLYYFHSGQQLLFSSEVRSLLATGLIPARLHVPALVDYLAFGSAYDPETLVEGVQALAPGSYLVWEKGKLHQVCYWETTDAASDLPSNVSMFDILPRLHDLLCEAVTLRLISDVPVGVFLSGGIDSSALVSLIAEAGQQVSTFSIVFREQTWSEAQYSLEVARRFSTDHHEVMLSGEDLLQALPEALSALDQPSIDGVNTYVISREVRRRGMKVALSGIGSDEIFAGYEGFRRIPSLERVLHRMHVIPGFVRHLASQAFARLAPRTDGNTKLAMLIAGNGTVDLGYFVSRMLFLPMDIDKLVRRKAAVDYLTRLESAAALPGDLDPINRVTHLELQNYMRNTLLRDADCMSMAHGLEVRVPFLDHKLVEFVTALPGHIKLSRDTPKPLLVKSLRSPLPDSIVHRTKRGFTFPFEVWMRGPMQAELANEFLNFETGPLADYMDTSAVQQVWERFLKGDTSWSRPWALFVLSRWVKRNLGNLA
jgi:asparagine synthase (glutamine-hydrolysing)